MDIYGSFINLGLVIHLIKKVNKVINNNIIYKKNTSKGVFIRF